MEPKIQGGAILLGSELNRLLLLKHDLKLVYGLAIRAIGQSTTPEYSAAVKVYAIYKDGQSFYFVDNETYKYKPTHGCIVSQPNVPFAINGVKFEHQDRMSEHPFCFCLYGANTIRVKIGNGPNFNDVFLTSDIVSDALNPTVASAFTFKIKKNIADDNQYIVNSAPCPPYWKTTDVPTGREGAIVKKSFTLEDWEEKALRALAETICADSI